MSTKKMTVTVGQPIAQGATPDDYKKANRQGIAKRVGKFALTKGADLGVQFASGLISNYFNELAERRADERTRAFTRDQFKLMAEGRRAAGLNPYGDATAPGQVTASSTESSIPEAQSLNEIIALEQLGLQRMTATAQANLDNAQAERLRGQEGRDIEKHPFDVQALANSANNEYLKGKILACDALLKEYTLPNEMALSDAELTQAQNTIAEQIANIALTNATTEEKKATTQMLFKQSAYLEMQTKLARVNIDLTYAQIEETFQRIATSRADELLKRAQTDVEREAIKEVKARIDKINAETAEIPASARVERNRKRIQNLVDVSEQVLQWFGAIATGGVSAGASGIIKSFDVTQAPPGLFDSFGNPIK